MRLVILGGGGMMARVAALDVLEHLPGAELLLADLNHTAAERTRSELEAVLPGAGSRVSSRQADATDIDGVRNVVRGAAALINAAQYQVNVAVMRAALAERVPYVDLGGLFHVTRRQLELAPEFAAAGVTAVIGMGSTPGITNVQARDAVARLDRVHRIGIYCANTPEADAPEAFGYSIHTILDELTASPVVFRDGELRELKPLAEPSDWEFLPPIGHREVHHSLHSEIATLPFSFAATGVRECFFKINYFGYTPRALRELRELADAMPRADLVAELERRRAAARGDGGEPQFVVDHEEVAVEVEGERDGRPVVVRLDALAVGDPQRRVAGGTLLTATPPAIVAVALADGSLHAPGVHPPEAVVEPAWLFAELGRRGMVMRSATAAA